MINNQTYNLFPKEFNGNLIIDETDLTKKQMIKTLPLNSSVACLNTSSIARNTPFKTKKMTVNDFKSQEIEKMLGQQAEQIENKFKELESKEQAKSLIEAVMEMEDWSSTFLYNTSEQIYEGVEFLENVLPPHIIKYVGGHEKLERVEKIFSLIMPFVFALDTGAQGLSLIYKQKILQQAKKLLKEININAQVQSATNPQQSEISQKIREWQLQVQLEEQALKREKLNLFKNIFYNFSYLNVTNHLTTTEIFLKFFSKFKIKNTASTLVTSLLDFFATGIDLKMIKEESNDCDQWIKPYKNLNKIVYTSADLLAKRQAVMEKKILLNKPHFKSFEKKIWNLKKSEFLQDMQQLLWQTLRNPDCTFEEVEEKFKKWKLYAEDKTKINKTSQNRQLLTAIENFKTAKQQQQANHMSSIMEPQKNLISELNQWMSRPVAMERHFQNWFSHQTQSNKNKEILLKSYLEYQETLEITTKNALKQMIQQKHTLESHFQNFKLKKAQTHFSLATMSLGVSLTLAILGFLSLPIGGAGLIFLILSVGSSAINLGLSGASYYQSRYYKPHETKKMSILFQAKMTWAKLKMSIHSYSYQIKEKKLIELSKVLYNLFPLTLLYADEKTRLAYQEALKNYKKAKINFEQSRQKIQYWTKKLEEFEDCLAQESWKDFAKYASLQVSPIAFDTLKAFQEALKACDLSLLSQETKSLLEVQLGVNLKALQAQIKKQPEDSTKTLREFFILDNPTFINFIRKQQARIKRRLVQPFHNH